MNNVLLDPLPSEWVSENGKAYQLDTDFQIGIQICLIQDDLEWSDIEKISKISELLFIDCMPEDFVELEACIHWYLNGWNHDKHKKSRDKVKLIDFDIDQWRIYSAFLMQYKINLNEAQMHWWEFMGLLSTLEECAYTRVLDIRQKKIDAKMSKEEKKALAEVKEIYSLGNIQTPDERRRELEEEQKEKEILEEFNRLRSR